MAPEPQQPDSSRVDLGHPEPQQSAPGLDRSRPEPLEDDDDLRASLQGLSVLASNTLGLNDLLTSVANFAVHAIPGADGAGLTLLEQERPNTIVATAEFVSEIDDIQYGLGQGPCISAAAEGQTMRSGSLGADPCWPRFGGRIARLGVHSVVSLPLVAGGTVLGAMNVYAHAKNVFDERAATLGEMFAVPAAISVQNAQVLAEARRLTDRLESALVNRRIVERAVGIMMSRGGGPPPTRWPGSGPPASTTTPSSSWLRRR